MRRRTQLNTPVEIHFWTQRQTSSRFERPRTPRKRMRALRRSAFLCRLASGAGVAGHALLTWEVAAGRESIDPASAHLRQCADEPAGAQRCSPLGEAPDKSAHSDGSLRRHTAMSFVRMRARLPSRRAPRQAALARAPSATATCAQKSARAHAPRAACGRWAATRRGRWGTSRLTHRQARPSGRQVVRKKDTSPRLCLGRADPGSLSSTRKRMRIHASTLTGKRKLGYRPIHEDSHARQACLHVEIR